MYISDEPMYMSDIQYDALVEKFKIHYLECAERTIRHQHDYDEDNILKFYQEVASHLATKLAISKLKISALEGEKLWY